LLRIVNHESVGSECGGESQHRSEELMTKLRDYICLFCNKSNTYAVRIHGELVFDHARDGYWTSPQSYIQIGETKPITNVLNVAH
jgi:hypothetical protein